jgi:thiol-disulfide isomerase/thioredoxin
MILFYSNYCSSCQMLLEQIERYNKKNLFKLVCVEKIKSKNMSLPSEVQCVPTLFIKSQKKYIHGKNLLDYLLLPSKGLLLTSNNENKSTNNNDTNSINNNNIEEPIAFGFGSSSGDIFSFIEENNDDMNKHKQTIWSSIDDNVQIITNEQILKTSDESNKNSLPDVSQLRAERETDIQNHLNSTPVPDIVIRPQ